MINKKSRRTKEYIPGYKSAAYAILKVLYNTEGLHMKTISLKAEKFTDAVFDNSLRFSAFSAFKVLEKKKIIVKESDKKYFLTEFGKILCRKMFQNDQAENDLDSDIIKLIIDSREKKNKKDNTFFQSFFNENNILNATRFLGVGDFLWIKGERILNYVVERKAGTDFTSSIFDGRYREQKRRLRESGLEVYYIIENLKYDLTNIKLIEYCMIEIRIDQFILIETDNIVETGNIINLLNEKVKKEQSQTELSYGSFIEESSKRLTTHDVLLYFFLGIRGLNKEKSIALADHFGTMNNFCESLENTNALDILSNFKVNNKKIGNKLASKIIEML